MAGPAGELAEKVAAFCEASIRDWHGRAARMLVETPELATCGFATAVVLGDTARVRAAIADDPGAATRPDPRTGWTPLHAVCASRWHRLDPARASGLVAVAEALLDAGADPAAPTGEPRRGWTPLRCAVAGASNPDIVRLLLDRGAVPEDEDLYLACFGDDDRESLRLLLPRVPDISATTALSAPISTGDTEAVRMLLDAGADPNRPMPAELFGTRHGTGATWPAVYAAVRFDCPAELVELLLARGADPNAAGPNAAGPNAAGPNAAGPNAAGPNAASPDAASPDSAEPDGRSPYRAATARGRADLTELLRRHGARDDTTAAERLLFACLRHDAPAARQLVADDPGLAGRLSGAERAALVLAAERGDTEALELMLDLGFPVDTSGGDDGSTALHAAAYSGSLEAVRLLLARGADIEARDTTWDSTPLEWAKVGSGQRPRSVPSPDWAGTVRALLAAGASTASIELSPDDLKPASPEVADILRAAGVRAKAG